MFHNTILVYINIFMFYFQTGRIVCILLFLFTCTFTSTSHSIIIQPTYMIDESQDGTSNGFNNTVFRDQQEKKFIILQISASRMNISLSKLRTDYLWSVVIFDVLNDCYSTSFYDPY